MTASEVIDKGWWSEYCELTGTSEWAVNEGLVDSNEELQLPDELVAKLLGE